MGCATGGCWAGSSLRMTGVLCMTREGGALLQATLKNTALRGCYFQIPISPPSAIARTDLGVHTHPSPYSPGLTFRASGPPLSYLLLVFMRPCPCPLPIQASRGPRSLVAVGTHIFIQAGLLQVHNLELQPFEDLLQSLTGLVVKLLPWEGAGIFRWTVHTTTTSL